MPWAAPAAGLIDIISLAMTAMTLGLGVPLAGRFVVVSENARARSVCRHWFLCPPGDAATCSIVS